MVDCNNRLKASLPAIIMCLLAQINVGCSRDLERYEPLIEDSFFFHTKGEIREYKIKPKRLSLTEIAIFSDKCDLPKELLEEEPFEWSIKAEVFDAGKLIGNVIAKCP